MTVNLELTAAIMQRVQYRDVERVWDDGINALTDLVIGDLPHPKTADGQFDSDEAMDALDMITELIFSRFGFKYVGYCDEQVLTSDFDFAMASPGQNGKCKRIKGHDGGHDVRDEMQGM